MPAPFPRSGVAPYPRLLPPAEPMRLQPRRRLRLRLLIGIVVLATLLGGSYCLAVAHAAYRDALAGNAEAHSALVTALALRDSRQLNAAALATIERQATAATASFAAARRDLAPIAPLLSVVGHVPTAAAAQTVPDLLALGEDITAGVAALAHAGAPFLALTQSVAHGGGAAVDVLGPIQAALEAATPDLKAAQSAFAHAAADRARIATTVLPPSLRTSLGEIDTTLPRLRRLTAVGARLPALLGADGTRRYLVLFEDPGDVRGSGGYIGTVSLLTLDHGRLQQRDYEDSKQLQLPTSRSLAPLEPLFYYEGFGSTELRDANYWPDFPTSARHIESIYHAIAEVPVDGVIAVQPALVADLVAATGPLRVPGFPGMLTAANAVKTMERYTHGRFSYEDPHRKHFVVAVSHALLSHMLSNGAHAWPQILTALFGALGSRDLVASVTDPTVATALTAAHWDGALVATPGDYLGLFEQNTADAKLNPLLQTHLSLAVTRQVNGRLAHALTIVEHNRADPRATSFWIPRTTYESYLRVGLPEAAQQPSLSGYDDTFWPLEHEHGRLLVPGFLTVAARTQRAVKVAYALPPIDTPQIAYSLYLQRQISASPALVEFDLRAGSHHWHTHIILSSDVRITLPSWVAPSLTVEQPAHMDALP